MLGKLLIADDEAPLRRALYHTLGALGFEVEEASNAEEALEAVNGGSRFDVVVLDVNMPGMGGIEGCRKLRERAPGLQILMLTIRDHEDDKVVALDAGADDYITKPFSVPELAARIRSAMRRVATAQPNVASLHRDRRNRAGFREPECPQGRAAVAINPQRVRSVAFLNGSRRNSNYEQEAAANLLGIGKGQRTGVPADVYLSPSQEAGGRSRGSAVSADRTVPGISLSHTGRSARFHGQQPLVAEQASHPAAARDT